MAEVKWIKVSTDIFNDEKMMLIGAMPNGIQGQLLWIKLMCLAGKCNGTGLLMIAEDLPMDLQMLCQILNIPPDAMTKWMDLYKKLRMVEELDGSYSIANWDKYQSVDKMEALREYYADRQRKHREKLKDDATSECQTNVKQMSNKSQTNVKDVKAIDKDKEIDKDIKRNMCKEKRPTHTDVEEYCKEIGKSIDIDKFLAYYDSKDWKRGNNKIEEWKPLVKLWEDPKGKQDTKYQSSFESAEFELIALKQAYGEKYDEIFK